MKTPHHHHFFNMLFALLTGFLLLTAFSFQASAQGKRVYVGTGSGFIDYPTAQATLNLHDDDTVVINPGQYKLMNFRNITASPGHKIYIINSGQVEFNDPSPSTFSNLTNVEINGNGAPGIEFGFYMHDLIRGISVDGPLSGVTFSYIKMVNIRDYSIILSNNAYVYDGTNSSLFYDLHFLHFSVTNILTTFLQIGAYTRIVEDGMISMARKVEVAYCTVDYTDQEDVLHLNKTVNANVHHNRFSHLGANDFRHTGIVYLYGNGDIHHNYINDYWGSGVRAHGFNLDTIGAINIYDNIIQNSRKYSAVEIKATEPEDLAASPYLHYCNYKVYNNTFGNLSAYDWNSSMVDTYDAAGGTMEIKNNLGFNIQRDKPYDPTWNYIYQKLNITVPDTIGNIYAQSYTTLGLVDDSTCLLTANSPAVDKGTTLSMVKDDIADITRPQGTAYDIGAREYKSGIIFPVANAGRDTSVLLPKDSITLNGSASYNPGGGLLSYKWSLVTGPAPAVFAIDTLARPLLKSMVLGTYKLQLTVTNSQGRSSSDTVLVVVSPVPVAAPVAKAGGTITITLPVNSTGLSGSASVSTAGPLKYVWTKLSGPTSFTISGDSTATPFISSLTEGTYQVKLLVTDTNYFSGTDIVTIIVQPAPVPVANAGADVNLVLPANSTALDGSASTTPAGGPLKYVWTQVSGPSTFTITGDTTVHPTVSNLAEGVYQFKLTVTNTAGISNSDFVNIVVVAAPVAMANAGADISLTLPVNSTTLNGTASYSTGGGTLTYLWSLVSGPTSFTITNANTATPIISDLTEGVYQIKLRATNAQGSWAEDVVAVTVSAMPVYPPVANAGADIAITLPANTASLNGDQSYNPAGGALTYAWTKLSGPASFTITGASSATPNVSNLMEGAYQIQLKVTNALGSASEDTVFITVIPAAAVPPVANAGADITITLPVNATTLNGTGSSNAAGGVLTYAWSLVSGPASFSIAGQSTTTPSIGSLTQGVYQVKLVVTNAQGLSSQDVVAVTVNPAPAPVANAGGSSVSLVLPNNSVALNGSASYDPSGGTLTYSWAKVSGPAAITIAGAATATPTVSNLTMGTYQVQLTVTNTSGLTATAMVNIIVTPSLLAVPNAGRDTTVYFPNGYAILDASQSYATGGASLLNFHWQQLSGPSNSLIGNSETSRTTATNLEPGAYVFQLTVTDTYGQKATTTLKVSVVATTRYVHTISVYPNPCTDRLRIHAISDSTGEAIVRVTSMAGIIMLKQSFQKTSLIFDEQITVSQLSAGMYIVEVIIGGQSQLLDKFIKR